MQRHREVQGARRSDLGEEKSQRTPTSNLVDDWGRTCAARLRRTTRSRRRSRRIFCCECRPSLCRLDPPSLPLLAPTHTRARPIRLARARLLLLLLRRRLLLLVARQGERLRDLLHERRAVALGH